MIVRTGWRPEVPEDVLALFRVEGLELVGVADAEPAVTEEKHYAEWIDAGYHGSMDYLHRHRPLKFRPSDILPGTHSILFAALNYYQRRNTERSRSSGRHASAGTRGRIARYAWGRDYHKELGNRLRRVARRLSEQFPDARFRPFTDATPLHERFYAEKAGIGFTGRHTLLINGELGSWFFLGEILSTHAFPASAHAGDRHGACPRRCRRCIDVCPTGALLSPYRIDASRCISYLTIEHSGSIPEALRRSIGPWLFGCDLCQEVCPLNVRARTTTVPAFTKPIAGDEVDLEEILLVRSHDEFVRRFAGSPVMRAGWKQMIRNAAIVAANRGAVDLIPRLEAVSSEVDDPVVREHVEWALQQLTA